MEELRGLKQKFSLLVLSMWSPSFASTPGGCRRHSEGHISARHDFYSTLKLLLSLLRRFRSARVEIGLRFVPLLNEMRDGS